MWRAVPALLFVLTVVVGTARAQEERITPSHVYQQSLRLLRQIDLLREAEGVTGAPRDPGVQYNKLPLHVYAKGLEVMGKIATLQQKHGLEPVQVPPTPTREFVPMVVLNLVKQLEDEVVRVKQRLGVNERIAEPRFEPGKIPSDVYQALWQASFALDGLIPALTPNHVYRNTEYILAELQSVAQSLGATVPSEDEADAHDMGREIVPRDVLVEAFKNLYRVGGLQRDLGLEPFTPPAFPIGKITPSDPFDATSMLLAELVRVKRELGIRDTYEREPLPEGKTPADVLAHAQHIGVVLNELAAVN